MDLSIIIPVKNHGPDLRELLSSLRSDTPADIQYEIIVVDDASQEDIAAICHEFAAHYVRQETCRGPAHARNTAARLANAAYLLFLDADIVPQPGMVESVVTLLREDPEIVGVSFVNQAYRAGDSVVRNFGALQEHYWFSQYFTEPGQVYAEMSGITTRNGAVRKSVFDALDGFDASFQTNAIEDYDFGKRLAAQGKTVMVNQPVIYHKFPDSLRRLLRNYWVRVTLFVPYQMRHRHQFDKVQIGPGEAGTRMLGAISLFLLILAFLPTPLQGVALALGLVGTLVYGVAIRRLLEAARDQSGGWGFPLLVFLIHWVCSAVICAGGVWGLISGIISGASTQKSQSE